MIRDYPEIAQLLGAVIVLLAAAAVAGSIFTVARQFLFSQGGDSVVDRYLASGMRANNPPDIPPSYSGTIKELARGRDATHGEIARLDDPQTQLEKFEARQTTTTRELRNIE